jgi:tetratricopeptide (TPR) repeat protein
MTMKIKTMKHTKYFLIILMLGTGIISCKKSFLDKTNQGTILTKQDYIADLKTTDEYLNGIYTFVAQPLFGSENAIYPELIADNIKPVVSSLIVQYSWNQKADEIGSPSSIISGQNCNNYSYTGYQIIRSANLVLENAEEYRNQNPARADAMRGQAYTIRALMHFMLVNFFAQSHNFTADGSHPGIAYITSSNWTDPVKGRNTVAEVYANMISDLNKAIALLPSTSANTITISRNAAMALLARVYLFKGDWERAKNISRQVGIAVPIMTVNYPAKLFTPTETEALFQLPPTSGTVSGYQTMFASVYFRSSIQYRATSDIAVLLNEDPNDVRKAWVTQVPAGWNIVKFPEGIVSGISPTSLSYYHTVIRSSEMYLTAAEAYAQLNNVDSARFYLDAIRKRANPAAISTTTSGTALLEAIYKERRKELAFEGLRMFDLLRWKKGVNRTDALSVETQSLPYPSSRAIAPIPLLDVKVSGLAQNADY